MSTRTLASSFAISIAALSAHESRAGTYGTAAGGTLAGAYDGSASLIAGGELSAFQLGSAPKALPDGLVNFLGGEGYAWAGGYTEIVRDVAAHATRVSIGPEVGAGIFGVDAGALFELSHGDAPGRAGATIRLAARLGLGQIYARYNHYVDDQPGTNAIELGLLIKIPYWSR